MAALLMRAHATVEPDPLARGWFKLYRYIDRDGNGRLEYHELLYVIRTVLRLEPSECSDAQVQSFWLAVDADANGCVSAGEFGKMMRLGQQRQAANAAAAASSSAGGAGGRRGSAAGSAAGSAGGAPRMTLSRQRREEAVETAALEKQQALEGVQASTAKLEAEARRLEELIARNATQATATQGSLRASGGVGRGGGFGGTGMTQGSMGRSVSLPVLTATAHEGSVSVVGGGGAGGGKKAKGKAIPSLPALV